MHTTTQNTIHAAAPLKFCTDHRATRRRIQISGKLIVTNQGGSSDNVLVGCLDGLAGLVIETHS